MHLREIYYNHLMGKLLHEEGLVNFAAYQANPRAHRKGRIYQKQLETRPEMSWSGDSTESAEDMFSDSPSSGDVDPQAISSKGGFDADRFIKDRVIEYMSKAQEEGHELAHGDAQRMAIEELKKHIDKLY